MAVCMIFERTGALDAGAHSALIASWLTSCWRTSRGSCGASLRFISGTNSPRNKPLLWTHTAAHVIRPGAAAANVIKLHGGRRVKSDTVPPKGALTKGKRPQRNSLPDRPPFTFECPTPIARRKR